VVAFLIPIDTRTKKALLLLSGGRAKKKHLGRVLPPQKLRFNDVHSTRFGINIDLLLSLSESGSSDLRSKTCVQTKRSRD